MTTYKDSGVDIEAGDHASRTAYEHAISTFRSRKGMIGSAIEEKDGYAGFLDMGEYYLVQTSDGTGSKMSLAAAMGKYDTLGCDLLAMVADDLVCTGAEPVSITNTLDVSSIDQPQIDGLMKGLAKACAAQKIVIPAGEIAEVPMSVNEPIWNAMAAGIVGKDRVIKPETVKSGDVIIALQEAVIRSNGFSLVRKILTDAHGKNWHGKEWKGGVTWGEIMLTPSIIYADAILSLIGRYKEKRAINVNGIAHITGGGIPSKLKRVLKKSALGAELDALFEPHDAIKDLIALGSVPVDDAYRTWNMGQGMLLIISPADEAATVTALAKKGITAKRCGTVTKEKVIRLRDYTGETRTFPL